MFKAMQDFWGQAQQWVDLSARAQQWATRQAQEVFAVRNGPSVQEAWRRPQDWSAWGAEAGRYALKATSLTFQYYNQLFELGTQYSASVLDRFMDQHVPTGHGGGRNGSSGRWRRAQLRLSGPAGREATTEFLVENHLDSALRFDFHEYDFTNLKGGPRFRPELRFEPTSFTLAAGETRKVRVFLYLSPRDFTSGEYYQGTVRSYGRENLELTIDVYVDPSGTTDTTYAM